MRICLHSAFFSAGLLTLLAAGPVSAAPETGHVKAAWTQFGPGGALEARAVVEGPDCPRLAANLALTPMTGRAAADSKFLTVCAAAIPAGTVQAAITLPRAEGASLTPLPLPAAEPSRILVLGDTGCRIKGTALQDCSDPEQWPFPVLAQAAAKLRPDLVIHVGDYLYREQACPADFKGCQGTPFGDNWPTWEADFFAPAAPLLSAAPWVIVRGNHEDCSRAGPGFLRLLGPEVYDPAAACSDHLKPFSVPLKGLNLIVSDNADAPETSIAEQVVPAYREEFAALAKEPSPSWWLLHRPIWGLIKGPLGIPVGGNLTLLAGLSEASIASPVELMLSGHIHSFEAINYTQSARRVPPQIVAGHGGDLLDPTPLNLRGGIFQGSSGVHVKDGLSIGGFGFLLMTKEAPAWRIDVYDWQGRIIRHCRFMPAEPVGRVECPAVQKRRH